MILSDLGKSERREISARAFEVLTWVLAPVWVLLLAGTLRELWLVFNGVPSPLATGSLGLGALIAAMLGAPFVVYGTYLRHKTNRLEQEGHMTDRISRAVEQLGAEKTVTRDGKEESVANSEVRIGAILSLERIAQDSTAHDKGRDHVRVMKILCAYVRENSNARKPVAFPLAEWEPLKDDASEEEREEHVRKREERFREPRDGKAREWAKALPKPRIDVQLALSVIGRRSPQQRKVEAAWPDPPKASTIWPFDTPCPSLPDEPGDRPPGKARVDKLNRDLARWTRAINDYRGYRLDLRGANLQRADMRKWPDGSDALFSGARLDTARLEGAELLWARMEGADLTNARLDGARLWKAQLEGAYLWKTSLEGANFENATLQGAALRDTRYSQLKISAEQLSSTFGDPSVTLPEGMARPDHWPDWKLPSQGDNGFRTQWRKWQADPAG